jgi:2-oxoisovalerate dehydrogenase E1 component beta subunit
MNMVQAINDALRIAMRRDRKVVVLGEDVGKVGGVFRVTSGLCEEFGSERVIDTPLTENGIIGAAVGMALYGMVPVPEIQFADFVWPAYEQIVSELSKYRYRSGGEYSTGMVIRMPVGGGIKGGHYHSQHPEAHFVCIPGLKVVIPSNAHDAKGLLLAAIEDPDPVILRNYAYILMPELLPGVPVTRADLDAAKVKPDAKRAEQLMRQAAHAQDPIAQKWCRDNGVRY